MAVAQILTSLARPALNAEPTAIPEDLSAWATAFTRITKHILVTIREQPTPAAANQQRLS